MALGYLGGRTAPLRLVGVGILQGQEKAPQAFVLIPSPLLRLHSPILCNGQEGRTDGVPLWKSWSPFRWRAADAFSLTLPEKIQKRWRKKSRAALRAASVKLPL